MTYPFDQFSALGKANGQLVAALAQIARESGEAYAQIGGKSATALFAQFKDLKPGAVPGFGTEPVTGLFGELEKSREASLARIKAAYDEWQGSCQDVLSKASSGQQEFAQNVQAWFQPLTRSVANVSEKTVKEAVPTPRGSARVTETA